MHKKKLYLSNTSIQTFLDCNKKFQLKYLEKTIMSESKANKYASFGNSIHAALAEFSMITNKAYRTLDVLHNLLRKNWIRDGYESIEEERQFGLRGLDMLTRYYDDPQDKGKKNLLIEEMIYRDESQYVLCGKIDKVYIREDGIVEILDFKTGNSITAMEYLQLALYLALAESRLGYFPNAVSLYYLSHNKKILKEIDEAYIRSSIDHVHQVCNIICNQRDFECSPTPYCRSNCEFYSTCDSARDERLITLNPIRKMESMNFEELVF
jgi:RecB family exonuclease